MSVASGFFLRAHAYRGDPVSWTPALLPAPAPEPLGSLGGYDTRRLAVMARGRLSAVRPAAEWKPEEVMEFATGAG